MQKVGGQWGGKIGKQGVGYVGGWVGGWAGVPVL